MPRVLCVVMTYWREKTLEKVIASLKQMSVPADIVIWNNGGELVDVRWKKEFPVFHGVNDRGMLQRLVPALLYPHEYVMFCDDDVLVGSRFLASAINTLEYWPRSMVVSGGSIIRPAGTTNPHNYKTREWFMGKDAQNHYMWRVDVGMTTVCVLRREMVIEIFNQQLGVEGVHVGSDMVYSVAIKNARGTIIMPPHDDPDLCGIKEFLPEHAQGKCSKAGFVEQRTNLLLDLALRTRWRPWAADEPEWLLNGEGTKYLDSRKNAAL